MLHTGITFRGKPVCVSASAKAAADKLFEEARARHEGKATPSALIKTDLESTRRALREAKKHCWALPALLRDPAHGLADDGGPLQLECFEFVARRMGLSFPLPSASHGLSGFGHLS